MCHHEHGDQLLVSLTCAFLNQWLKMNQYWAENRPKASQAFGVLSPGGRRSSVSTCASSCKKVGISRNRLKFCPCCFSLSLMVMAVTKVFPNFLSTSKWQKPRKFSSSGLLRAEIVVNVPTGKQ